MRDIQYMHILRDYWRADISNPVLPSLAATYEIMSSLSNPRHF